MFGKEKPEAGMIKLGRDGYVSAEDVRHLRAKVFADGVVSREELQTLFKLGEAAPGGDPEWPQYFAEAAADFFLREEEPNGYLTDEEFAELKAMIVRDGAKASPLELGLLVKLMEQAVSTPEEMSEYCADQIRRVVSDRKGGPRITREVADLIRRYLYAAGGSGTVAVTRDEAELLFDLHDMTAHAVNDPAWSDLFIKAIAAHLMAHVGYQPLPREEALRLHTWVEDQTINPAGFFNRMLSGGLAGIKEAYGQKSVQARKNGEDEIQAAIAEQVTAQEADWLADRIGRNGKIDNAERALLHYMREIGADLPPKLTALASRAA